MLSMIKYKYNFFKRRKSSVGTGLFKPMLKGTKTTKATFTIKTLDRATSMETFDKFYQTVAERVAESTGTYISAVITPCNCVDTNKEETAFTISATRDPKDCPYFLEDWKEAVLKMAKLLNSKAEKVIVEFSEVECISVD